MRGALDALGLASLFPEGPRGGGGAVWAAEDIMPHAKPSRLAFELLLSRGGINPFAAVLVDSSVENLRTAKALGMRTVLVVDPYLREHGFRDAGLKSLSPSVMSHFVSSLSHLFAHAHTSPRLIQLYVASYHRHSSSSYRCE